MIKSHTREMKTLSRILASILCCTPFSGALAAGNVATNAGSNLTAFNPSNTYNNQWASMTNGRYDANQPATADFGNCNSVILRCAQPKCANGGCSDIEVASNIVDGCVKSNTSCAKYGDDLIRVMSSQLVAASNAQINAQKLALEQAKIQAEAQAAAAANAQSQQQMQEMQSQMRDLQNQLQQQQSENARQLQEVLTAAQSAQTAQTAPSATTNDSGVTSYQQEAINRGISADILERQKLSGQIMTEIENSELALKTAKTAMQTSFEYANCEKNGNNCAGPKRVKKWRELTRDFIDPYNQAISELYDALLVAQGVGVDLSDIYMMLDDSCNSWGQFMCQPGRIFYISSDTSGKGTPYSCPTDSSGDLANKGATDCYKNNPTAAKQGECYRQMGCQPCTMLKILTDKEEVYQGWVDPTVSEKENGTVISCASSVLNNSSIFAPLSRRKNGANLVGIDVLETWINQTEPTVKSKRFTSGLTPQNYCTNQYMDRYLTKAVSGKSVENKSICCDEIENNGNCKGASNGSESCNYVNPAYAICDAHPYNAGKVRVDQTDFDPKNCTQEARQKDGAENPELIIWAQKEGNDCKVKLCDYKQDGEGKPTEYIPNDAKNDCERGTDQDRTATEKDYLASLANASGINEIREMVAMKTTVFSQQMYKQYEYLNATLRRLKNQLEKAIVKTNLQAAGAESTGSSSGLLGASKSDDKTIHLAGANNCSNFMDFDSAYNCLQTNVSVIKTNVASNARNACLQLQETVASAGSILLNNEQYKTPCDAYKNASKSCADIKKDNITACANALNFAVMAEKRDQQNVKRQSDFGNNNANTGK